MKLNEFDLPDARLTNRRSTENALDRVCIASAETMRIADKMMKLEYGKRYRISIAADRPQRRNKKVSLAPVSFLRD